MAKAEKTAKSTKKTTKDSPSTAKKSVATDEVVVSKTKKSVQPVDDTASIATDVDHDVEETSKSASKAGKRSAKSQREAQQESDKQERKEHDVDAEEQPKQHQNPTRTRLQRQGKKFRKSAELVDTTQEYELDAALELAQKTSHVGFDATVELHVNLNVDPRHADQNVRDNLVLPAGTGKAVKVAVLTDDPAEALKAGADTAGHEELLAQLEKGNMDFDILIAKPMLMAKLGKYARMLGPRGLMPNPKSGTVTTDITKAVSEAKAGRVEYRVDSTGIVHLGIGKVSFTHAQLIENAQAVLTSIKNSKPASVKSAYFKVVHVTTSMGPSIRVSVSSIS